MAGFQKRVSAAKALEIILADDSDDEGEQGSDVEQPENDEFVAGEEISDVEDDVELINQAASSDEAQSSDTDTVSLASSSYY